MNEEQIIEYCRKLITSNLETRAREGAPNTPLLLATVYELSDEDNEELLLEHMKGVRDLLEEGIKILNKRKEG